MESLAQEKIRLQASIIAVTVITPVLHQGRQAARTARI
jgi:hypothetical protein